MLSGKSAVSVDLRLYEDLAKEFDLHTGILLSFRDELI